MTRQDFLKLSKDQQIEWFRKNNQRELFELAMRLKDPNYQTLLQRLVELDDDEYERLIQSQLGYYEIKE